MVAVLMSVLMATRLSMASVDRITLPTKPVPNLFSMTNALISAQSHTINLTLRIVIPARPTVSLALAAPLAPCVSILTFCTMEAAWSGAPRASIALGKNVMNVRAPASPVALIISHALVARRAFTWLRIWALACRTALMDSMQNLTNAKNACFNVSVVIYIIYMYIHVYNGGSKIHFKLCP